MCTLRGGNLVGDFLLPKLQAGLVFELAPFFCLTGAFVIGMGYVVKRRLTHGKQVWAYKETERAS